MSFDGLLEVVATSQDLVRSRIQMLASNGMTLEGYSRYLTMQYHLTKGVQRYFLEIAAHPSFFGRRRFRDFMFRFALEEEPHYSVAASDLKALGASPGDEPFDVALWHAYFQRVVQHRPFLRLGAAAVLENAGPGGASELKRLLSNTSFINEHTSRFLIIHMHEELPHGDQILDAIRGLDLNSQEASDLVSGARQGSVMFLRMLDDSFGFDHVLTSVKPVGLRLTSW